MINLRNFPLGKGVLNEDGKLRVNSYGRGVITKYCVRGYAGEDTTVLLEDDFSNRDYLNGWLPGNVLVNYGQGRIQSEWIYQFELDLGTVWEEWDVSSGRFYLPYNNRVGFFFANPQQQFLMQPLALPTELDLYPDDFGFSSATPQYSPTDTEITIDEDNRHFQLDLEIGWGESTTATMAITPYVTALNSIGLSIDSGIASFTGAVEMSTGNPEYSSPIVLSFVWQTRGYEDALSPNYYFNQFALLVNGNELTRSHCRVGTLLALNQEGLHSPAIVANFKRLLADLVTWEETYPGRANLSNACLLKINETGTNPSEVYISKVTLSRATDVFDDCAINGIGAPQVTIQNATATLANGTYNQESGGSPRFANSSRWCWVSDSSFPLAIGSMVIGGGPGIPRAVSITQIYVRMNEYARLIVRVNFAVSGGSPITMDYAIAGIYPNYEFPVTVTKAKSLLGAWGWNPLGDDVEFVVDFI